MIHYCIWPEPRLFVFLMPNPLFHGFLPFKFDLLSPLIGKDLATDFCQKAKTWPLPQVVVKSDKVARPDRGTVTASEYQEDNNVLQDKVKLLSILLKNSTNCCAYTGAGISTASGIKDYASKAEGSVALTSLPKIEHNHDAQPTFSHHALTALHFAGFLRHWIQQNHDGLPQKAGFPQECINEIHGAWFDPANPVIKMEGSLREDLFQWLQEWAGKADFCLVLGTSLVGMNADQIAVQTAKRCIKNTNPKKPQVHFFLKKTQSILVWNSDC